MFKKVCFWTLLLALSFLICWTTFYSYHDQDFYWHSRTGLDWIERGLSPFKDHYSFTFPGAKITLPSIGFDIPLAIFEKTMGMGLGGRVFGCLLKILPLFVFALAFRRRIAMGFLLPAILLFGSAMAFRPMIRPEATAFLFELALLALYSRARVSFRTKDLILIQLLLLVWCNTHTTAAFGYIILVGLYFERVVIALWRRPIVWKQALIPCLWGAVSLGVGFLNPSLTHPILFALRISPEWSYYIVEHTEVAFLDRSPLLFLFWVITSFALPLFIANRRYGAALITAILSYQTYKLTKILPQFLAIVIPLLLELVGGGRGILWYQELSRSIRMSLAATMLLACAWLGLDLYQTRMFDYLSFEEVERYSFPVEVLKYMKERGIKGNILNDHGIGGYVVYQGSPDLKVYIDGRTNILYPVEHMRRYQMMKLDPQILIDTVDQYKVDWVLGLLLIEGQVVQASIVSGLFDLEYVADRFALLKRAPAAFPAATKLFYLPGCWSEEYGSELRRELEFAKKNLPQTSELTFLLSYAVDFLNASDKVEFIKNPSVIPNGSEKTMRFAAYLAMKYGLYEIALNYLQSMGDRRHEEMILQAKALLKIEQPRVAENILAEDNRKWIIESNPIQNAEADQVYQLLLQIKSKVPLERFSERSLTTLKAQSESYQENVQKFKLLPQTKLKSLCELNPHS